MRLVFVSHSFSPPDRPLANIGGMQRVAMELDAAVRRMPFSDQVDPGGEMSDPGGKTSDPEGKTSDPEGETSDLRGKTSDPGEETSNVDSLEYDTIVLTASWKWVHLLAVPFLIRTYFLLAQLIRRRDVDVILFSSMVTAALAVLLRPSLRRNGVRTAAIVHGQDVTKPVRLYQMFVPKVFSALDLVMPVSGATAEACVERGLAPDKVAVVHNGVKLDRFSACAWPAGNRSAHPFRASLPPHALLLASVGRQVKRKGFAWFIEHVLPELPDHVHYWLGGDGPEHATIEQAIQEKGLQNRVKLLGRMGDKELTELYQSADVFVMPNIPIPGDMEGFGIVMLEAAMNGLPAVAAHLEGIREVITPGKNGYFVESGDVAGYVSRLTSLDSDRASLSELSATATSHVSATFGWDAVALNYVNALRRLSS